MILASPWWLLLGLLASLPWVGPFRGDRPIQNLLRSFVFLALAIALARPQFASAENRVHKVTIVDRSSSIPPEIQAIATAKIDQLDTSTGIHHLIVLGSEPLENELASKFQTNTLLTPDGTRGSSSLPHALSRAQQLIPDRNTGNVTVLSDGLSTRKDDYRAVSMLRRRSIPVHWVDLTTQPRRTAAVTVDWHSTLRQGTSCELFVRVACGEQTSGTVELEIDGEQVGTSTWTAEAVESQAATALLEFEPTRAGYLDAQLLVNGDREAAYQVTLPIAAPHRLLYLGAKESAGEDRLSEMLGNGFEVTSMDATNSEQVKAELQQADLVMLDDMVAKDLPLEIEQSIASEVQQSGLGLVMSGGRASFGAGGWHKRPIEELLPVEFVQKEEKRDPSTSLVIVIDTSGSMTGVRVQLAKEVARLAMRRLLPHDKVGIVEFYGAKRWAAPLQPASNAIELQRALNRMDAGGGTVILPALEEAFYGLQNVDTRYKHVLVLTDGGVESGDFESLMRRMAKEGINVSTVLAGGGYHSEFLVNIANWGKGRFYNVPNRFNLPEILLKQPSTTKLPAYRPGVHFVQARGGSGWWGDANISAIPTLNGYVESKARAGSEVLLETVKEKHPVIASWRYGLGRVTTIATEPLGSGTEPWQQWDDYGQALTRLLQRTAADARDPFRFQLEQDGIHTVLNAYRQHPRQDPEQLPVARLQNDQADGEKFTSINFIERSPDHFQARLPGPLLGEHFKLTASSTGMPARSIPLVAKSIAIEEQQTDPSATKEFAAMIASLDGKQFSMDDDWQSAPVPEPTGKRLVSLSSPLFAIALLLFLAELIYRRMPKPSASQSANKTSGSSSASKIAKAAAAAAIFMAVALGCSSFVFGQSSRGRRLISNEVREKLLALSELESNSISLAEVSSLFDFAVLKDGSVQPTLDWLAQQRGDFEERNKQILAELEVHIASRFGELPRASMVLNNLLEVESVKENRPDLLVWQAKLEDAMGNVEKAKELYEALVKLELPETQKQSVSLRLALMDLIGPTTAGGRSANSPSSANNAKSLIELAEASEDQSFKNRAANVLAVQNKHADAIKLFMIQGEGTERFRSASRVTEWAIRANDRDKAIESGWIAVDSAQLRRDKNYALALLVESYRLKEKKKGLEALIQKFKDRSEAKEPISSEMRTVWINLLRELGQYDEAIQLFKESADGESGFTVENRRELLEMQAEAGYEDRMLASYRELIESEPDELAWRSGLTQILLEKGQEQEAKQLWQEFVQQTDRGSILIQAAQALGEFGLDDLASETIERMVELESLHGQALLYWSDLKSRRGDIDEAEETLNQIQSLENIGDDVRAELASAYERLGRQDKAIEVNEAIRASRETVAEDLEMRLAWLYSEVGDEEKALEQWLALWKKITSIPRRRYVEDRLMTVASRLGTLADIAIELEEKLADGTADDREAGLLVRIYSRVNDSVAATEISEDYMSQTGKNEVEQLQEKGRIYQICNDYWNYEKVIERLIEVDPEGKTEYLRQLALSMLERGKAQEARDVLMTLRGADDGKDSIGGEFEAGVLSLVGMNKEAAEAYRKGIATYPDRIESYLLLANLLKEMGLTDRAVGMFQYLAENAERDDLFTIAIDGILNMEARGPAMQWARRITLERLAGREDKNYLYQLLSDLSFEVNDKAGQIRAMENSLAVSGSRRLSVLRECMELSSRIRGGIYYSTSSRGPTNKGNQPFFAFGRRLIGLGELMPPQVFLDLGQAFLDDGDTKSAERTFNMARNLADPRSYQREVALIFEKAAKTPEALVRYDKLLRTSPSDVALIARVAKLNEQEGKDEIAFRFYKRGLELLLSQTPLSTQEDAPKQPTFWSSNRDAYQTYSQQLLQGLLVTLPDDQIDSIADSQIEAIKQSFSELKKAQDSGRSADKLTESPRIQKLSELTHQICFALNQIEKIEELDSLLVERFPKDEGLLIQFARERVSKGRYDSVERTLASIEPTESQRKQLLQMLGKSEDSDSSLELAPKEMWQQMLPAWIRGDRQQALSVLRRVNQKLGRSPSAGISYVIINGVAVPQSTGGAADVTSWMRLAKMLGDDGLALQFARSQMRTGGRYNGPQFRQQFEKFKEILPDDAFGDLVRFTANLIKEDKERAADYLFLISKEREHLEEQIPDDDALLELIEDANLEIGYYFPFTLALEVFPESIQAEALSAVMSSIVDKYRPRELIQVPFMAQESISKETADTVLEWLESGIEPAIQDDYLRYSIYNIPRSGQAVQNPDNADFAIRALDLFLTDRVRQTQKEVPQVATYMKAVVLHQSGKTEEALELVLENYDPNNNPTDYYVRNAQTFAYSELVPVAPERFIAKLEESQGDGKPTVALTNQKISIATQTKNEDFLRQTYKQAIKDHPDQTRFTSSYERWEQGLRRNLAVIEMLEAQISDIEAQQESAKSDEEKSKAEELARKLPSLRKRLVTMWRGVNNLPKALPHWIIDDDKDIEKFAAEKKSRAEKPKSAGAKVKSAAASNEKQADAIADKQQPTSKTAVVRGVQSLPATSITIAATPLTASSTATASPIAVTTISQAAVQVRQLAGAIQVTRAQPTGSQASSSSEKKKTYPTSMSGVKRALDDKDEAAAQKTLRKIWRAYPPVVASPYGRSLPQKRVTGLTWPSTPSSRTSSEQQKKPPTDEEKEAAAAKARERARGGIATFTPPVIPPRKRPENAWNKLAEYPFAVSEMQRLVRSQLVPTDLAYRAVRNNVSDISLGILKARRAEIGDDKVFAELIANMTAGNISDDVLAGFFTMLEEDYERINEGNIGVIDVLMQRLDLTNAARASQLADLCGRTGQKERARALFRHCALLSASGGISYAGLIEKARESFEGEALLDLAEEMFTLSKQTPAESIQLINLRAEVLASEDAASRTRDLMKGQLKDNDIQQMQLAVVAAPVFAKVGDYETAAECLDFLLEKNGQPRKLSTDPYRVVITSSSTRNLLRTSRRDLIKLFPESPEDYESYSEWLSTAASFAASKSDTAYPSFLSEMLLTIALRQLEAGLQNDAKSTLQSLPVDAMNEAETLHPLAMDLYHKAGLFEQALSLESKSFKRRSLNHLRFGDLLRHTYSVNGTESAKSILTELTAYSFDEDLLAAAEEVAGEDEDFFAIVTSLKDKAQAAEDEYKSRTEAAAERNRKRAEWRKQDAASASKKKNGATQVERPPSPKRNSERPPSPSRNRPN